MNSLSGTIRKMSVTLGLLSAPALVWGQDQGGGDITFGTPSAIPQLSGPMLLALAAIMALIAWRMSDKVSRSRFHPMVMVAGGAAMLSAVGGAGLISGANAIGAFNITDSLLSSSGGKVTAPIQCDQPNYYQNDSSKSVTILSINLADANYWVDQHPDTPCEQGGRLNAGGGECAFYLVCDPDSPVFEGPIDQEPAG